MNTKPKPKSEAVLPLKLFTQLRRCDVSSLACDSAGDVVTSPRSYKGRDLLSRLTVWIVSEDVSLVHRCAALLLLQSGGRASFYRSRNLGGVFAIVSLPVGVHFVVEDC